MKTICKLFSLGALLAAALSCNMGGYYMSPDAYLPEEIEPQMPGDSFDEIKENEFVKVADQPVSTFSIDADGASYAYVRRCLINGYSPSRDAVRIEEFLNYFTFDYPDPSGNETVAINAEIGDCPWAEGHKLLRLGLKGKSLKENEMPDANFIFLIDNSGSMSGSDRIDLLKDGLCNMVDYMRPTDRVAIITYGGGVRRVLESTLVSDSKSIKAAIKKLTASGFTPGGAAMKMAYDEAVEHYIKGGNNRIIMCTDGDFNVGVSSTDELVEMVESYLDKGIYLSIMGFGTGNYQDSRMESISNHGNGTYTYIDSEDEMMKVFVHERSHFVSVAADTKCQVRFTQAVDSYRLIGYENRVMNNEDFENDKKDAGEIGAGQTITAVYELVPAQEYAAGAAAADFEVRYKLALGGESRPLLMSVKAPAVDVVPSGEFNFAAGITAFGLSLRDSKHKGTASLSMARDLITPAATPGNGVDPLGLRPKLLELISTAEKLQ